jgi:hypothetical protein
MQDQLDQQTWIDQTWGMIHAAQAAGPAHSDEAPGLDRPSYEVACRAAGVPALADGEIDTYAVKYGDWLQVTVEPLLAAQMTVARWRNERIEHERAIARQVQLDSLDARETEHATTARRCLNCGRVATMHASLGPACDDCYDELSG